MTLPLHMISAGGAAFLASLVEAVEALTVVLAIGSVRGWRAALIGAGAAAAVLLVLCLIFGPALTLIPIRVIQAVVGSLLLLFGLRWLRKAILRAGGVIALHDEAAAFDKTQKAMRGGGKAGGRVKRWDRIAFAGAFNIVMLEGIEVVFIVIAIGAGGPGLILPAGIGALAAVLAVILLGVVVHRPLARVPENTLKFIVGILLSAFGTFWAGEGIGVVWPGGDGTIGLLVAGYGAVALGLTALLLFPPKALR